MAEARDTRGADASIRLDCFLWYARFARTRSIAQALVGEGHVRIDGRPARKPSVPVRVGQIVGLPLHGAIRIVRVEAIPARRGPATEAQGCYTDLAPVDPGLSRH